MKLYTLFNKITGDFDKLSEIKNDVIAIRGFKDFINSVNEGLKSGKVKGIAPDDFELYCVGSYSIDEKRHWNFDLTQPTFVCDAHTINSDSEGEN